jgi:hypothetical protein
LAYTLCDRRRNAQADHDVGRGRYRYTAAFPQMSHWEPSRFSVAGARAPISNSYKLGSPKGPYAALYIELIWFLAWHGPCPMEGGLLIGASMITPTSTRFAVVGLADTYRAESGKGAVGNPYTSGSPKDAAPAMSLNLRKFYSWHEPCCHFARHV